MRRLATAIRMWLHALTRSADADLDREIASHLAIDADALEARGIPGAEAHRQARLHFGAVEQHKEAVRDERGTAILRDTASDLCLAWRSFRRQPVFTAGVLLTLGIGIGATTAVFGWANWLLWRPVPGVSRPSELTSISFVKFEDGAMAPLGISLPDFLDVQRSAPLLARSAGYTRDEVQIGRADAPATTLQAELVAGDFFGVLGVTPALGRFFVPADLAPASDARLAVISDAIWRAHFGATPAIIGRTVQINALPFTIIGVAPRAFRGTDRTDTRDIWLPLSAFRALHHSPSGGATDPTSHIIDDVLVRRPDGLTPEAVQAAVERGATASVAGTPDSITYREYPATIDGIFGTPRRGYEDKLRIARMMLGVVAIVLLIACANSANLLLLRGIRRRGEFAVRRALGASTGRLVRQHGSEALVLAVLGAAVGVILAVALSRLFGHISMWSLPAFDRTPFDDRVVAVAALLAVVTSAIFGIFPALAALRSDPLDDLRDAGRNGTRRPGVLRGSLTVIQVAAALSLVVGALLLVRTVHQLGRVELGLDPHDVTTIPIFTSEQGYSPPRLHAMRTQMIAWMEQQPGVIAVATGASIQFGGSTFEEQLRPVGTTGKKWPVNAASYGVSPRYFAAMGIPLIAGRSFSDLEFDDTTSNVVLISRTTARALFGAANPVGRQFEIRHYHGVVATTVIGVVGDTRIYSLRDPFEPTIYRPSAGPFDFGATLVVRSTRPVKEVARQATEGLAQFDPALPIGTARALDDVVATVFASERLFARLLGILAAIAALLAGIGLYTVIACSVSERKRELGIRMALGALGGRVVSLVVRQGLLLAGAGIIAGLAGAFALSHALRGLLFGITPTDTVTYVVAAMCALVIALAACVVPARSATRINPVEALRNE